MLTLVLFVVGLGLVIFGADALVRGSASLASALGAPPLIVGLTVVAMGTSAPEVVVSLRAAVAGQSAIAVGNVVGSNIFNVLFILGISALVTPLAVSVRVIRQDVPIMVAASALTLLLAANGMIGRLEGGVLLLGIVAYSAHQVRAVRRYREANVFVAGGARNGSVGSDLAFVMGGLAMLVLGAGWFIDGAVAIAGALGVSELVVGLTIVAAGTSLPELATSIAASARGERDIAVGNVVGSNIFNLLFVLGGASLLAPAGIAVPPAALSFDLPVMVAVAIACLPIFFTGYIIARWEGAVFLAYYIVYAAYLVLHATQHEALGVLRQVMLALVLPLTVLVFAVVVYRSWRAGPRAAAARAGADGGPRGGDRDPPGRR